MHVELDLPDQAPAPCLSWRLHVHSELTRDRTTGQARVPGRSRHEPVRVTRRPDRLSPLLLHAAASGAAWPTVTLRMADDDGPCWLVTLTDVLVISVLSSLEEAGPLETVDLSYGAVTWSWLRDDQPQRSWVVYQDRP